MTRSRGDGFNTSDGLYGAKAIVPLDTDGAPIRNWGPASQLVAITPNDSTDLTASNIRGLWVGGAGNVAVIASGDSSAVTLVGVPAGTVLPIAVIKVMATNTTATSIVGMA